jgi:phosphate transport system permease
MFGLVIFIEIFGFTSMGNIGKSLLAGALTITLVVLPTFTRSIQQSLKAVPMSIRENAYGLGCSK